MEEKKQNDKLSPSPIFQKSLRNLSTSNNRIACEVGWNAESLRIHRVALMPSCMSNENVDKAVHIATVTHGLIRHT